MNAKQVPFAKIVTAYLSWSLVWTALQCAVLFYSVGLSLDLAIKDSFLNNGILAVGGYAMINVMRFYQPRQFLRVAYSIGVAIICTFAMEWLSPYIVSGEKDYLEFVERSLLIRAVFGWLIIGLISASTWLFSYIREQQEFEERRNANEKLAKDAELSRIRQQLQPHFLFNSLNSISALVVTRPDEARNMIQQLSDFLRGTLKKDDQQLVPLSEELAHLGLYLEIEKVRFGHRLKTHIDQDDTAGDMKLPSLLLQPIVENAIKFGLYDTTGDIIIRIKAASTEQYLTVIVENPFDPETTNKKQGTTCIRYIDRFLMFYIKTADPLTRTAPWLNKMEGGLSYLYDVIVNDSLGIGTELEADMAKLIEHYHCEWKKVVESPALRNKFKHFVNDEDHDPSLQFVDMRGQKCPVDWNAGLKK